jgi:NAD(P)-dependent dehydrogenase (short-subunit alcohol dehydrogenase family)
MRKQDGGVIINVGTVLVDHSMAGLPDSAPLASKGGIHALTNNLASELASDNIRVNTIAPGVIRTPLYGDSDVNSFGGIALLDRVGEVKDTTAAILYLADADFVTGVTLNVDGGYVVGRPAA